MKTFKRILQITLSLLIIIFIVCLVYVRHLSHKALPDYNANIPLKGLTNNVEVYRDEYGMPHIYATNEKDLYTTVGYLMAQDRLWQMDLLRRVTLGRLSEIFGESFIHTDLLLRALKYSKKSKMLLKSNDENFVNILNAFANGVNQFIESHKNKLPLEFTLLDYKPEPWEPFHSLNLIGYMAWDLKAGWNEFLLEDIKKAVDSVHFSELLPDSSIDKSYIFPGYDSIMKTISFSKEIMAAIGKIDELGIEIFNASNNWAVSGDKSKTGKPILANDMHLSFNLPGIWYQMHQVIKGQLNVTGLVLPGQPLIICGHNENIAWGMTNTFVDNIDFYLEKVNTENKSQYLYLNEWKNFQIKKETIHTKEGNNIKKEIWFNHRGPVISEFKGIHDNVVTMKWVGDEYSNEFRTVYLLNHAKNWGDFKNAVHTFKSISQNIAYADVEGNIGLYCCAGVPIRNRDIGYGILPGWTDKYEWKGMVPFNELPHIYNPKCGYVASANNKTVSNSYPYHIGSWYALPHRMDRIRELLETQKKLSVEDFKSIQLDQKSKLVEQFSGRMTEAFDNYQNQSQLVEKYISMFKSWDGNYNKESVEATIFEFFYLTLIKNIFSDELGEELFNKFFNVSKLGRTSLNRVWRNEQSVWIDDIHTEKKETWNDVIIKSFEEVIAKLNDQYGTDDSKWKWGNIHQLTLKHPLSEVKILNWVFKLNRGPYKVGGSFHTISPYSYFFPNPGNVTHGASHRHIFSLADWDKSLTIIPTGNSGIPSSKHYCDQTNLYIDGMYKEDLFKEDLVKSKAKYHMTFSPER